MRLSSLSAALLTIGLAASAAQGQQALVCPPASGAAGSKPCEMFHYHILAWRPDTRRLIELTGINRYSSQQACEAARESQLKRNLAVVDYFKRVRGDEKYEPDRFGPCHCDMTTEKTSAAVLTDLQRNTQVRTVEEVRLRVRERLLDSGVTSDSELVRGQLQPAPSLPLIGGPRLVPIAPAAASGSSTNAPDDLRPTKAVDNSRPSVAALDLPLVEPGTSVPTAPATTAPVTATPAPAAVPPAAVPVMVEAPSVEPVHQQPAPPPSETQPDEAEGFISYETQRIQYVLKASGAISDESVKSRIFEACMQRIQLLSNLRILIEGSGVRSRLAAAARAAQSESERLALVSKIFGAGIAPQWAPKDAADVVLPPDSDADAEPERVLRDNTGRYGIDQKKRALYVMLARTQPTEEQQLWLVTVIDSFLR